MTEASEIELPTGRRIGRGWVVLTTVALWVIFLQAVTARRIFSGDDWARTAHRTIAGLLTSRSRHGPTCWPAGSSPERHGDPLWP